MGRKSKADQRRIEIIQAYYQCVIDQGAAGASIRKIAEAAGVKPSTLHHYFKNREEIIEEAVVYFTDRIFRDFREQVSAVGAGLTGTDRMDRGMEFIFSKGMINEDHTGFFLECLVVARHNSRIKATIADLFRRFRGAIVDHLEQLQGFERLGPSQREMLASTIVAIHEGIELQWFVDPDRIDLARTLETTRDIVEFFMNSAEHSSLQGG